MNASRLREIIELLLQRESEFGIQKILTEVNSHLSNLVGAPQEQVHQKGFSETLNRLRVAMNKMIATFEPSQIDIFVEIGADHFFSTNMPGNIQKSVQKNPITPAVSQEYVAGLLAKRQTYISEITQLRDSLKNLGIEAKVADKLTAEIGFLIPRELFQSQLDQFIKQLGVINRIIREFSETATGSAPKINIRGISSSDPLIFFALDPQTIAMIGGAVTWALNTWKQAEEIKKLRNDASKVSTFKKKDLKLFDDMINTSIKEEVKAKTDELLELAKDTARTKEEKRTHITWTLKTVLALVERGLKIEVRLLRPLPQEGDEEDKAKRIPPEFKKVAEIIPQLVFPRMEGDPILQLPQLETPAKAKKELPAKKSTSVKKPPPTDKKAPPAK